MNQALKRLSVKISYGSMTGASFAWDAASQRRKMEPGGGMPVVQVCEPNKVLIDAVEQLATIAAIAGIPLADLRTTVSDTYKGVEARMKENP